MGRGIRTAAGIVVALLASAALALDEATRKLALSDDSSKRWEACVPLVADASPDAVRLLAKLLADPDPGVRDHAAWACWDLCSEAAAADLAPSLLRGSPVARRATAAALARSRRAAAVEPLGKCARGDSDASVRAEAAEGMRLFAKDPAALAICVDAAKDRDPAVRACAVHAAGRLDKYAGRGLVHAALADRDEGVRATALESLWKSDAALLVPAAADLSWRVRTQVAESALWMRKPEGVDALLLLVGDAHDRVGAAAARGLRLLTQKDFGRDASVWSAWWAQNRAAWKPAKGDLPDPRTADAGGTRAKFMGVETEGEATVFVLDFSGSMLRDGRHELVRMELAKTLAALPDKHRVNVILFSDRLRAFDATARPLAAKTREAILDFVRGQTPGGETDMLAGILRGLDEPEADCVYLLSDGAPSVGDSTSWYRVKALVKRRNRMRKALVHVIGMAVKDEFDRESMTELAAENGGRCVLR